MPASAVELGEVNIQSTLGQPLRASIAYALGPNEQLAGYCINLIPAVANDGLPAITSAGISVANGVIALTGAQVIREPLMSLRVNVNCPYTPRISREYMLFIDPSLPATASAPATASVPEPQAVAETSATAAAAPSPEDRPQVRRAARRAPAVTAPVNAAERYLVRRGDTLSEIAARIDNRPVGLWDAVAQIFEANPAAFIDNDPNKLKADSWLDIPAFGTGRSYSVSAGAAAPPVEEPVATVEAADIASYEAVDDVAVIDAGDSIVVDTVAAEYAEIVDDTSVLEAVTPTVAGEPQALPGSGDGENPFVGLNEPDVVIPDTEIAAPATASRSPNVPTARISPPVPQPPEAASSNWLLWLIGGGVALIAGLLIFGRRNRKPFDPESMRPAVPSAAPQSADEAIGEDPADLIRAARDDEPTMENLALDADLIVGTGLQESGMHVNEDFGFATESNLDLELPEDEDYDMSVNVDATKIQETDEVTERDLKAVLVDDDDDNDATDNYTVSQEIDYQILAQDYEDEMTATQALNIEIEKAAAQIAKSMDQSEKDDLTAELQLATVTELELASRESANDSDDEGEERTTTGEILSLGDSLTLVMPKEDQTEPASDEDDTVQTPRDDNTVEMPMKSRSK